LSRRVTPVRQKSDLRDGAQRQRTRRQAGRAVRRVRLPARGHRGHRILRQDARVRFHRRAQDETVRRRGHGQREPDEMARRSVWRHYENR